jgi:hypothetical protein
MNCIDLAEIHAAALGLADEDRPDVLHCSVAPLPPSKPDDLRDIQRENRLRLARIAKQRHPWRRKAVAHGR